MHPYGRLAKAGEPHAIIENRRGCYGINMIKGRTIVDAEQKVAGGSNAIDHAGPVAAELAAVIVRIAEEHLLFVSQHVVETIGLGVEIVPAHIGAKVVVTTLCIAGLIG